LNDSVIEVYTAKKNAMRRLILLFIILCFSGVFAGIPFRKSIAPFIIYKTTKLASLSPQLTILHVQMNVPGTATAPAYFKTPIYCSVNGVIQTHFLDSTNQLTWSLEPGKQVFKFWAGPGYSEIITDTVVLEPQTETFAAAHFSNTDYMISVDKPVIYFHPQKNFEFELQITPASPFSFTYPTYDKGWRGTAFTDGHLLVAGMNVPYLFWESKQPFTYKNPGNGVRIQRDSVVTYLEKQLAAFQFTQTEKTDFITYWGPKMMRYESLFVVWYFDNACNDFARISCTPAQPIHRFYMGMSEWKPLFQTALKPVKIVSPIQPAANYLIEWGGFEFTAPITNH
jgi:hypothetical protein